MRRLALIAAALALPALAAPAFALPGFEAGARGSYWFPGLSAKIQTFTGSVAGTKLDAKDDLGMKDENFASGEAFVRFGRLHIRVGCTPVSFDGSRTPSSPIVFNGRTFPAGVNVVSALDAKMLDGDVQIDLFSPDAVAAAANLGLIVKVKYVDGNAELSSAGTTEARDFRAPVPMVGLAAGVGVLKNTLRADARVTGIAYSGNHLFEGDVFVSVVPAPFVRLQGGYRIIDLKVDTNDIVAELRMKGPYAGAQVSF